MMDKHRIMYVCSLCSDNNPEGCGYYDRAELRVMKDSWVCDGCFDEMRLGAGPDDDRPKWASFNPPPEYGPITQKDRP